MKKNKFLRIAAALLMLCLITTCAIGGTFAKYITTQDSTDSARVAKWGVSVNVTVDGAFATEYAADATDTSIAKTVVSSTTDKLLAPGTGATLATASISGTPEVAVRVNRDATLELAGWEVNSAYYCPIKITISKTLVGGTTPTDITLYGLDYVSADAFIAAVNTALDAENDYDPNTNLAEAYTIDWEWAFVSSNGAEVEASDVKDTALGDAAVNGDITLKFTFAITVTQID